ncbi:MAG: hypothetical protein R6V19_15755 [Armatimonadota bacterium]
MRLSVIVAAVAMLCSLLHAEKSAAGYDIFLTLQATGPEARVTLDDSGDGGLEVCFGSEATELVERTPEGSTLLQSGDPAHSGDVHIRRRPALVEVLQGSSILLRRSCAGPISENVTAGETAGIDDLIVQPVDDIYFSDEFFNPKGSAVTWDPLCGAWDVGIYRDALIQRDHGHSGPIGASWYECTSGERALSVTGHDFWDRYRVRAAVRPPASGKTGLVFYAADADNYALLSVEPRDEGRGEASLAVVRDGEKTVLETADIPWREHEDGWYELAVEAHDSHVRCTIAGEKVFDTQLPAFTCGRCGLYADGAEGVRFDDFVVKSIHRAGDTFDEAGRDGGPAGWLTNTGRWHIQDGCLVGASPTMARCLRPGTDWGASSVSAEVTVTSGGAGVCLNWSGASGYTLGVADGGYRLARFVNGYKTVLARGECDTHKPVSLTLSWCEGRLSMRVNEKTQTVYDFACPKGRSGLFCAGQAVFDGYSAHEPEAPGAQISSVTGRPAFVPGKKEGTKRPVLGYIWRPVGTWKRTDIEGLQEPGLSPKPKSQQRAELWYYQSCPGDAAMDVETCTIDNISEDALFGLTIGSEATDAASGYAVEFEPSTSDRRPVGQLRLLRRGEVVAKTMTTAAGCDRLKLWREGTTIVGQADDLGLSFDDPKPLTGTRCGAYATSSSFQIGRVTLSNRRALSYTFREVETDWQPRQGDWLVHSGMACIDWDYWLTGRGKPVAMTYNTHPQPNDLHIDFGVSEYTEGFSSGEHRHYPYYNISLVTCAQQRSMDSGYRFLIGGENGRVTRLLRRGEVVAETRDKRFHIQMGGHCNSPRAIHVVLTQKDRKITLYLNDMKALSYDDPDPLPGGFVGIGCAECSANFRDFWMAPLPTLQNTQ